MSISVFFCWFGYDLLYILVGRFYRAIHLGSVRYKVMMFYLESGAYICYHIIVQVKTIIGYDSLWKSISTYNLLLDEPSHYCLCHTSI